jgi:hypothetical protein
LGSIDLGRVEKGRTFALPRVLDGFLFRPGKENHPQAKKHKDDSGAEVHIFGGYDLTYHGAQEAAQSRGQYQSCGGPEENRPLGMAFGGETEGGHLGFVSQFSQKNGTEGCENDSQVHNFSSNRR